MIKRKHILMSSVSLITFLLKKNECGICNLFQLVFNVIFLIHDCFTLYLFWSQHHSPRICCITYLLLCHNNLRSQPLFLAECRIRSMNQFKKDLNIQMLKWCWRRSTRLLFFKSSSETILHFSRFRLCVLFGFLIIRGWP